MSRTADVAEYYVAGRRVPALFNGMATGADWMSAASFIGMAGTLYLAGFDGLSFVMGWTGGYCLVAFLLAPYLRKFGQFTIPIFSERATAATSSLDRHHFGDHLFVRLRGRADLRRRPDTSRFTGLAFEIGVFVGLGGILVCSMLGGMRAVTWTQVAQYIILIIAYLTPVSLARCSPYRHSNPADRVRSDNAKLAEVEKNFRRSARSRRAQDLQRAVAAATAAEKDAVKAHADRRAQLEKEVADLRAANAPAARIDPIQKC